MNPRQTLIYNVTGQELDFYPPEWVEGVPTGTTQYRVFRAYQSNDDTAEIALASATSDTVDTTVATTAAGYSQTNRRTITVASGIGITVGRFYVIANVSGQRELVRVAAANGATITAETDLAYDYAITTSTFKGLRQRFTIDATFIATESKISYEGTVNEPSISLVSGTFIGGGGGYRVEWLYTLNSITRRHWTYFDVVRQKKEHGVTVADLIELWPDLKSEEWDEQRGQGFAKQIDAAFERVTFDSKMHGVNVAQLRAGQYLDELVRSCTLWLISEALSLKAEGMREIAKDKRSQYREDFQQAIGVLKLAVDQGTEGGATPNPIRQITFRR